MTMLISFLAVAELPALDVVLPYVLCGAWPTPMQSKAWLSSCYDVLYPKDKAHMIEVEGAVGPFARRGYLVPTLYLVGSEELAEAIEPPVADAAAAARLSEAILATRLPVRFGHIPAEGLFAKAFVDIASGRGFVTHAPAGGSPVIRLDASWKDPLARFSSRRRSDFRRMQRRAEAMGPVTVEILSPAPDQVHEVLDRAFAVEAMSWKSRNGTAITQTAAQASFLKHYGRLAAGDGRLKVAFLHIGEQIAAMQIMVEEHNALWLLKIGYDEHFAKASPGALLMFEVIRDAAGRGLDRVEFLGKAAPGPRSGPRNCGRTCGCAIIRTICVGWSPLCATPAR
jgi:hypothetical protein